VRTQSLRGTFPLGERVVGRVEALQISVDVTSRAPRAFSRAPAMDSTIEQPPWVSWLNATRSVSDQSRAPTLAASMPSTFSSVLDAWSGSTLESSSSWCT